MCGGFGRHRNTRFGFKALPRFDAKRKVPLAISGRNGREAAEKHSRLASRLISNPLQWMFLV